MPLTEPEPLRTMSCDSCSQMRWSFIIFFPLVIHSSAKPVARVEAWPTLRLTRPGPGHAARLPWVREVASTFPLGCRSQGAPGPESSIGAYVCPSAPPGEPEGAPSPTSQLVRIRPPPCALHRALHRSGAPGLGCPLTGASSRLQRLRELCWRPRR